MSIPNVDVGRAHSTAAQRLNDNHFVRLAQRLRQVAHLLAIDEDANVGPYTVLLVDHAKTNPGVATLQVNEDGAQRCAACLGFASLRIRAQRAGDEYFHETASDYPSSAASTA